MNLYFSHLIIRVWRLTFESCCYLNVSLKLWNGTIIRTDSRTFPTWFFFNRWIVLCFDYYNVTTNFPHYFRNFESRNFFRKLQVLIKYCHILWHRSRQWNLANLICKSLTFQSVLINWMKLNNWFYFEFCFLKDEFCETAATARSRSRFVFAVFARHFTRWMGKGKKINKFKELTIEFTLNQLVIDNQSTRWFICQLLASVT